MDSVRVASPSHRTHMIGPVFPRKRFVASLRP